MTYVIEIFLGTVLLIAMYWFWKVTTSVRLDAELEAKICCLKNLMFDRILKKKGIDMEKEMYKESELKKFFNQKTFRHEILEQIEDEYLKKK